MLTTGNRNARQNSMRSCAWYGAVATVCLARDDRWTNHALGQIISGIQFIDIQEAQQMRTMFSQALGEAGIVAIAQPALRSDQGVKTCFQVSGALVSESSLKSYHLLPSVRADLLAKLGRFDEACEEFKHAASLTRNTRERELLLERAATMTKGESK